MNAEKRSAHPTPDQLDAWLEGNLPEGERRELEAHFESCAECRELAADLRGFATLEDPSFTAADEARILGRVRQQILAEEVAPVPFVLRPAPIESRPAATPVLLHPAAAGKRFVVPAWAAAAFVLIVAGVAVQRQLEVGRLEQELALRGAKVNELEALLEEPLGNPVFVEARPREDRQRSITPRRSLASPIFVVIKDTEPLPEGTWRVQLKKAGSDTEYTIPDLVPYAGQLRFVLRPDVLPPGDYEAHLFRGEEPWPQVFELPL